MATETRYRKIYEDLLSAIRNGTYKEGDRLPSEKDLAEQYGVSRITSKKAFEMLNERGFVFRYPGKGTFVSVHAKNIPDSSETDPSVFNGILPARPAGKPLIGIIMDSANASFGLDILRGMEYECCRLGMLPVVRFTYGSIENERQAIRDLINTGISGLTIICIQDKAYNEEVLKLYIQHFPIVQVDRQMPGIALPVATTDNYKAARELTDLLLDAGHSRIGYVSHSHIETSTIATRFRGFCDALRDRGIQPDPNCMIQDMDAYIPKDDDEEVNIQAYKKELSDFVDSHMELTAFFAVEFYIAKLLYIVLYEKGLIEKKQIVYFDGFPEFPAPISYMPHILQNQYQIGVRAIWHLNSRMHGGEIASESEFIPYSLIGSLS